MTNQNEFSFVNKIPTDPNVKPIKAWFPANQGFYADFRKWLRNGGYGDSALNIYGVAARLALGWLDEPYWLLDPQADLDRVREYIASRYERESTRISYYKGIAKLEEYLRHRCHRPAPERQPNWSR